MYRQELCNKKRRDSRMVNHAVLHVVVVFVRSYQLAALLQMLLHLLDCVFASMELEHPCVSRLHGE